MNSFRHLCATAALAVTTLSGCGTPHGQPLQGSEILAPSEVLDFETLYAENCAGCHGAEGRGGAAIALADPVYLAIAEDAAIRKVIASGVHGTAMPAFAESSGGMLTDKQIDVITTQIRLRWGRRGDLSAANLPVLSWAGRPRRTKRQPHHGRFFSRAGQRSRTAHDRHRWPS